MDLRDVDMFIGPLKGDTCVLKGSLLEYQVVNQEIEGKRTKKAKQWLDTADSH